MPTYVEPHDVTSPKISISNLTPVCDRGEWKYSIALLEWDHKPRVGMRWNGGPQGGSKIPHPGNPQSRGLPTWFVVPEEFGPAILQSLLDQNLIGGGSVDVVKARAAVELDIARSAAATKVAPSATDSDFDAAVLAAIKRLKAKGEEI